MRAWTVGVMPASSAKPAPLALGVRDVDGGNRVEMLTRPLAAARSAAGLGAGPSSDVNVDQLLSDFAREARSPRPWSPPEVSPAPREPSEMEQLRVRVAELETRLRALEAASQLRNDGAGRLNQRVLAVLEQLVAELRERA